MRVGTGEDENGTGTGTGTGWPRGRESGGVDFTWGWWSHHEKRRRGRHEFRTGIGTAGYLWLMTPLTLALSPSGQRGSRGIAQFVSLPDLYRIKYNC